MKRIIKNWKWCVFTVFITFILGAIDWLSGYDLNFFVFYFLPVSLAAWLVGRAGSVCLAIICALVWFGADILTGHVYPSHLYPVWNTMIRLVSFLAIGWSVSSLKQILEIERETSSKLRSSLAEIKVLKTFLPICAQCKKIRNDEGDWQQLETYITEHSDTQFSHGLCPECYRMAMDEANLLSSKIKSDNEAET